MPRSAPSIRACGCVLTSGEKCQHSIIRDRERKARFDQTRPSARARGYDSKWQEAREGYLAKHPHCFRCGNKASVVHHLIPHKGDKGLFWDRTNWKPACKPCHDGPLQAAEKRP